MQTEMKTEAMPFGMIITVMNYDELTEMNTEMNTETKPNANRNQTETRAKKNVKNVENVKKYNFSNKKEDKGTNTEPATLPETPELSQARINEGMQSIRETLKAKGILKK